jgi:ferredoxin-nitrate reductase
MEDRIADIWGRRTPYPAGGFWPHRPDTLVRDTVPADDIVWTRSACVLCSNGCGLDIGVYDGAIVGVRGRTGDRVNHGRLGPKGLYGWQANGSADRLTMPQIRRHGRLEVASWDEAMDLIVEQTRTVLAEHGPLAVGFYTSGQLFLEDYYTLAVLARGGIGTPHLDGNTRLCTATAAAALKESFGSDGPPGSITDLDLCDTIFTVGHNMAETHTVLWARILDRMAGPDRPRLVVVDPRRTRVAAEADVHLPIRAGTNVALLNAIQHELIAHDWIDQAFVAAHTVGVDGLDQAVAGCDPAWAAAICGVPEADIRRAAEIIGTGRRLVSTCLQGVYQSHQATAAACQVNNITLLRGMIGKPGCTVFQMNGQPTAQNTRETGANGDLTGMRNWQNPDHVAELAALWQVPESQIPAWAPPTHIMQMMRLAEQGSLRFLWICGTNPAVSLPDLDRVRATLAQQRLFVVVTDAFATETTALADVVLPAAIWAEKTGTFTNHDRTVHLSEQAISAPGQARTDMNIFRDYATRLDLRTTDGKPLIGWHSPEDCFAAFAAATSGRPCDYSGLSYQKLRAGDGIQWPCTDRAPEGTDRLYTDHRFHTDPDDCEDFGHDLLTGAAHDRTQFMALGASGRAILKPAEYVPAPDAPDADYPLQLTTGRTVYHWHTRTKTRRIPRLNDAAPEPWLEIRAADALALGIDEGDLVRVESRHGAIEVRARLSGIREGMVFVPFHYGSFDAEDDDRKRPERAANELIRTSWDPVSKQPVFKSAAVRVIKIDDHTGRHIPAAGPSVDDPPAATRSGRNRREGR